jgi:hypothetical protein
LKITPAALPVKHATAAMGLDSSTQWVHQQSNVSRRQTSEVGQSYKGIYPSYWEEAKSVREQVPGALPKVQGKGTVSAACNDCHGRGKVVNQDETEKQGVPVMGNCKRCGGRGYERILSTAVHSAICQITDAITLDTWKKSVKPFFDVLITKFDIEEAWAEAQLKQITR